MGKRGSLSRKSFFPNKGDMLENHTDGMCWKVLRSHVYVDEKSGERVKYVLLVTYHEDYGDGKEPIIRLIHSKEPIWFLDEIDVIQRKKAGGYVKYEFNEVTGTWQA